MAQWTCAGGSCRQLSICLQRVLLGKIWDAFPTWKMEFILIPKFLAEALQLPAFQHTSPGQGPQHVPVPSPSSPWREESQFPVPCQLSRGTTYCCCSVPGTTWSHCEPLPRMGKHMQICPESRRARSILKTPAWILQTWHMCELAPPDHLGPGWQLPASRASGKASTALPKAVPFCPSASGDKF